MRLSRSSALKAGGVLGLGILATTAAMAIPTATSDETLPLPETVVWAVGDICRPTNSEPDCEDVGALIKQDLDRDAVLMLGDGQYEIGALSDYLTYYDPKMGEGAGLKTMTLPVPGNHEYKTAGAAGYYDYFGPLAGERGKGWHSELVGDWRVIGTNSNCTEIGTCSGSSPQGVFMRAELKKTEKCELVFDHHPAFSDGSHGDTKAGRSIYTVSSNNGADLFLSGHDHSYQRFAPRSPDGTVVASGLRQLVVGTGGSSRTTLRTTDRTEYRQNTKYGAVRLVLTATGYTGEFIAIDGTVMDTFSGSCR